MNLLAVAAFALLMASCANDDTVQKKTSKQLDTKGMTEFAVVADVANAKTAPTTRTTGEYTGSSVKFYWTSGDQLWINNATVPTTLKVSSRSTIPATNAKEATAKFWFDGIYTAPNYPVRYTGTGNPVGNKVTIKATQEQQVPNDGSHIGTDGDCGTAVATRQPNGSYQFMLDHKASYLTFAPFDSKGELATTVNVTQIKVTASENIAGTYDFDDSGILTTSASGTSKSITLTLSGAFTIPSVSDYNRNGAIMVLAPGTYTNLTVEYTLRDSKTGVSGTVSKMYNNLTLNAGKNRIVKFDLGLAHYDMKYYMWDAGKDYWDTYAGTLPITNGEQAAFEGINTNRYFNGNGESLSAVNSCKICPNANEAALYAWRGDPHWDGTTIWVMNKHLYVGGMWFKKLQYCSGGPFTSPVTSYPGYGDYRQNSHWVNWNDGDNANYHDKWVTTPIQGKPSDTGQYFYLPAMGYLANLNSPGKLQLTDSEYYGAYWSSTGVKLATGSLQAVVLHFSNTKVGLDVDDRKWSYPIFEVQ